jgi:hypothetical protein
MTAISCFTHHSNPDGHPEDDVAFMKTDSRTGVMQMVLSSMGVDFAEFWKETMSY